MDCCNLSSTGLQDIDANDIIADNITVLCVTSKLIMFSGLSSITWYNLLSLSPILYQPSFKRNNIPYYNEVHYNMEYCFSCSMKNT